MFVLLAGPASRLFRRSGTKYGRPLCSTGEPVSQDDDFLAALMRFVFEGVNQGYHRWYGAKSDVLVSILPVAQCVNRTKGSQHGDVEMPCEPALTAGLVYMVDLSFSACRWPLLSLCVSVL